MKIKAIAIYTKSSKVAKVLYTAKKIFFSKKISPTIQSIFNTANNMASSSDNVIELKGKNKFYYYLCLDTSIILLAANAQLSLKLAKLMLNEINLYNPDNPDETIDKLVRRLQKQSDEYQSKHDQLVSTMSSISLAAPDRDNFIRQNSSHSEDEIEELVNKTEELGQITVEFQTQASRINAPATQQKKTSLCCFWANDPDDPDESTRLLSNSSSRPSL